MRVIPVKSNGGNLDSGSVGMDLIVEDFGSRYLSLLHIEEIKTHNPNNNRSTNIKGTKKGFNNPKKKKIPLNSRNKKPLENVGIGRKTLGQWHRLGWLAEKE